MVKYLVSNKWTVAAIACGLALFFGVLGHWTKGNATVASANLLQGDYGAALEQYERAANKGDPTAQNTVGNIHYLGLGVQRDYEKAARWYLRAAKKGNGSALVNLGILHLHGLGVQQDYVKAYACFRLADKIGIKNADIHMKFLSFTNQITANMVHAAMTKYRYLPTLTKNIEIGTPTQQPQQPQ